MKNPAATTHDGATVDCEGCPGLCCRHTPPFASKFLPLRADGSCFHLVGDLCDIYEHRPEVCQAHTMAEQLGLDPNIYLDAVTAVCNDLKKEYLPWTSKTSTSKRALPRPSTSQNDTG